MPTLEASGTQTAVINTEHTLATLTTAKVFVFVVDCANLAAGDILELRIYHTVLAAGASRVAYRMTYHGVQNADDLIKLSVPVPSDISFVATLKQTAGIGRLFPWKVLSI